MFVLRHTIKRNQFILTLTLEYFPMFYSLSQDQCQFFDMSSIYMTESHNNDNNINNNVNNINNI